MINTATSKTPVIKRSPSIVRYQGRFPGPCQRVLGSNKIKSVATNKNSHMERTIVFHNNNIEILLKMFLLIANLICAQKKPGTLNPCGLSRSHFGESGRSANHPEGALVIRFR